MNPRQITEQRFQGLVDSILSFPKMLQIRPIVIDDTYEALGGNMRTQALNYIAKMKPEEMAERIAGTQAFRVKTEEERGQIIDFWGKWLEEPFAYTIMADELSEDEKKQFIIKDNLSYGTWDYDALANEWNNDSLRNWGMEIWDTNPVNFAQEAETSQGGGQTTGGENAPQEGLNEASGDFLEENLPPELQGIDLNPDQLPAIKGDDDRPCDYVIITYEEKDKARLLEFLGISPEKFTNHICYTIDEIEEMKL